MQEFEQFLQQVLVNVAEPTELLPSQWSDLESYTCREENVLHWIARHENAEQLLRIVENQVTIDCIRELISFRNDISETPFHYACKYANLPLFNFIAQHAEATALQDIAESTNTSLGRTPLHLLCEAAFQDPDHDLGVNSWLLKLEYFEAEPHQSTERYQAPAIKNIQSLLAIFLRFREIFTPEVLDAMIIKKDWFGIDGLLLSCYTCDPELIASYLKLFSHKDQLKNALQTVLRDGHNLTPIRFLSALSTPECIQAIVQCLGETDAAEVFGKQNALDWCYGWSKSAELRYALAVAYGDELERAIITHGERRSILCTSLHRDGVMAKRLIEKKHIKSRYEIVCEVFFSLYGKVAQASPRQSPRLFQSNGLGAHRELLAKILRIKWPDVMLQNLGEALMAEFKSPDKIAENCKTKLMNIINTRCLEPVSIPLALMYKLTSDKLSRDLVIDKSKLNADEAAFVTRFQTDRAVLDNFFSFYQGLMLESEGNKLAQDFLTRLHKSRSLLLLTLLDTLKFPGHFERTITERFVATVAKLLTEPLAIKELAH